MDTYIVVYLSSCSVAGTGGRWTGRMQSWNWKGSQMVLFWCETVQTPDTYSALVSAHKGLRITHAWSITEVTSTHKCCTQNMQRSHTCRIPNTCFPIQGPSAYGAIQSLRTGAILWWSSSNVPSCIQRMENSFTFCGHVYLVILLWRPVYGILKWVSHRFEKSWP